MYIIFAKPISTFKNVLTHPFKWVIKIFSQSKFNHTAHTIPKEIAIGDHSDEDIIISEAKSPYYRHIGLKRWFKESQSKIFAYKVIIPIDEEKLKSFERKIHGRAYDAKGAVYSETEKWFIGKLFKRKNSDKKIFCSEANIRMFQELGHLPKNINGNLYSPQEFLELILDLNLVNPTPELWEAKYFI